MLVFLRSVILEKEKEKLIALLSCVGTASSEVSEVDEEVCITPGSPSSTVVTTVNETTEDCVDTTNPYAKYPEGGALSEIGQREGDRPLYVVVFGDEEERSVIRIFDSKDYSWKDWAALQLERADEALVAHFGIDIRILGFEEWDSDDSETTLEGLWYELWEEKGSYVGHWYTGEYWADKVDAIFGITNQETPDDSNYGIASGPLSLDQGKVAIIVEWFGEYWADDNLAQHEISHLFYVGDHDPNCCAMANHRHYMVYISEDGYTFYVWRWVSCCLLTYDWCSACDRVIRAYLDLYTRGFILTIRQRYLSYPWDPIGTVSPPYGAYSHRVPCSVTITVKSIDPNYEVYYWLIDGEKRLYHTDSITVSVDLRTAVAVCFRRIGGDGCPTLFVWNGTDYVEEGFLNIHAEYDITVRWNLRNTPSMENGFYRLRLWELDNYTSHIDYVKLYAIDYDGIWHECTLEGNGDATDRIRYDDGERLDLPPAEAIDLKFSTDFQGEIADFVFEINGYNMKIPLYPPVI